MHELLRIRDVQIEDVWNLLAIYNDIIVNTNAIWSYDEVDHKYMTDWLANIKCVPSHTCLIGEDELGEIVGYVALGTWRSRIGYRFTAEVTLHLRRDQRRKGYGSQLLQAIIAHAQQVGLKNLIAVISGDNDEGLAFFKKFGFETAGHFKEVGWKNGKWLDLVQLQLSL